MHIFIKKRVAYGLLTGIPFAVMSVLCVPLGRRNPRQHLFKGVIVTMTKPEMKYLYLDVILFCHSYVRTRRKLIPKMQLFIIYRTLHERKAQANPVTVTQAVVCLVVLCAGWKADISDAFLD